MTWQKAVAASKNKMAQRWPGKAWWFVHLDGRGAIMEGDGTTWELLATQRDWHVDWEPNAPLDAITRLGQIA